VPDVILMDIRLPDMEGTEVVRRLKAESRTAGIPVIALTAYAMKGDRERFLAAGCDGYLEKPVSVKELPEQVRAYCRREEAL
jgi:two-component system cell cycle response regulator DivK